MPICDTLITHVQVLDGSGSAPFPCDVALQDGIIIAVGKVEGYVAGNIVNGHGNVLAPGFIDVHTHDDISVIRQPDMLPKLSQGVTTVIVGNCGISAAPVRLKGQLPDPMNLLGTADLFQYPDFASYVAAVDAAHPAVNVAALVGHTALRQNHMDQLDRTATVEEIEHMRVQLLEALAAGALGLSTGLAYLSAFSASSEEVLSLAGAMEHAEAIYITHMRSETEQILPAMEEAFGVGRHVRVPVVISHLKCAGVANWGRSGEVLQALETARHDQPVSCDCYPYAAGSSTLDLRQVDERVRILITWSERCPEMGGKTLREIAAIWQVEQMEAARRLQPAGAIYHSISEDDMRRILCHPATMIGSDGLPNDPLPHPRLWGTFPRVLGHYSRDLGLFPLSEAIRKMTSLPAARFGLADRGMIREGYKADLVLFDPAEVRDVATFESPVQSAEGIHKVWVNGVLSYSSGSATGERGGRFLRRQPIPYAS